jgi:hypothetical protein
MQHRPLSQFPKLRKFAPVVVTWLDATTDVVDVKSASAIEDDHPCVRRSIGWWVGVGEHNVIIAMERDKPRDKDDTDCGGIGRIPRGMVTDIQPLALQSQKG